MNQYNILRQPVQVDMSATSTTARSPGFLPMEVAQTSFLVDRLGTDCGPAQFLRSSPRIASRLLSAPEGEAWLCGRASRSGPAAS